MSNSTRRVFAVMVLCAFFVSNPASATPPDRPIDIEIAQDQNVRLLTPDGDSFYVPVNVVVNVPVKGISLNTEVYSTDTIVPSVIAVQKIDPGIDGQAATKQAQIATAKIPVMREQGVYKELKTALQ